LFGHLSPIVPSFADRSLSRHLKWSASEDDKGKPNPCCLISLGTLQYIGRGTAGPTEKKKKTFGFIMVSSDHIYLPILIELHSIDQLKLKVKYSSP
jgi:hypothetical protein